ncbi:phenylalanine--tRNA ligase subunit beta [Mycetocola manganoxydans]|uniref:Phenylalanine--tRNA ligase beta subunit n=1 Tax=Mycetocola manganoxydans TaxID=699879 RepID=A0A3L6ZP79_9MICO|nr:phenylalanine--tRNA ligase subunit beta [Mycetocola manganoxydans]RLP69744.1 phenylalanine--tRNA ligase subunit beta [Mycetocola manganoxydans]GHD49865.1 phenylalanine--tRNA ligase beta subunit [Mycetocola manganoxydans]
MRVPLSWLAEYVDLAPGSTTDDVHAALVKVGLEEEDVHTFDVTGPVVVGEVLEFTEEPQKNGKTIRWCQVRVAPDGELAADGGPAVHGIVCGAGNFFVGDKVVVTLPGAVLPGPFPITPRKTYGHVSDGMIASTRELGLGDEHDGILRLSTLGVDAPVGTDAIALLGLDDAAVEINVTPDRGYAFSIRGVAREYAHATGATFRDPALRPELDTPIGDGYSVAIDDASPIRGRQGASVFATRIVRGVDASLPTPPWMMSRLKLAGIRSISLLVDITNYVMLELGQPIHGYDLDALAGGIVVRRAVPTETLETLDGQKRTLDREDLLITDGSGAIGIAGVMGGARTEMGDSTRNVLIEAANFDPVSIARTARRHKLPSEASKRFERGVDPSIAVAAASRVAELMVSLAGGEADAVAGVVGEPTAPQAVSFPDGYVSTLIGVDYTDEEIRGSLQEIGATIEDTDGGLLVTPPTWRPDLTDKSDLAEEVARIVGYDRIPSVLPVAPAGRGLSRSQRIRRTVADTLAAAGSTEILAFPFLGATENNVYGSADSEEVAAIKVANALDATSPYLRTTLIPGLIEAAKRNLSRGLTDLSLFEVGLVFRPEAGRKYGQVDLPSGVTLPTDDQLAELNAGIPPQPRHVGVLILGNAVSKQPGQQVVPSGIADALAAVTQIGLATGATIDVVQGSHKAFHPGRTAELRVGDRAVGFAGELLPQLALDSDLPRVVAVVELDLDAVIASTDAVFTAGVIGTLPAATQDLSLVVSVDAPAAAVGAAVREGAGELLESIRLVDDYRGSGLEDGTKSLTFALRFRAPDRTLTAAEATEAKLAGSALAAERFGAAIRD